VKAVLKIRLRRMGAKHPFYRVVVSESRFVPKGRFVDVLGTYDPRGQESGRLSLDVERTEQWIRKGAHPSETVRSLLAREKRRVHPA
jgi:small subunit ribosomal protein S16